MVLCICVSVESMHNRPQYYTEDEGVAWVCSAAALNV